MKIPYSMTEQSWDMVCCLVNTLFHLMRYANYLNNFCVTIGSASSCLMLSYFLSRKRIIQILLHQQRLLWVFSLVIPRSFLFFYFFHFIGASFHLSCNPLYVDCCPIIELFIYRVSLHMFSIDCFQFACIAH